MKNFTISFPGSKGMLHIADNLGGSIQLNPVQAMDLMDFLLRKAEMIRRHMSTDALETAAWESFQRENAIDGISEAERLSLLEPTPFDSGVCKCGAFVEAGRLHEHQCHNGDKKLGESRCDICFKEGKIVEGAAYCLDCGFEICGDHIGDPVSGDDFDGFLCTNCTADLLNEKETPQMDKTLDAAGEMRRLESNETWKAYLRGELD